MLQARSKQREKRSNSPTRSFRTVLLQARSKKREKRSNSPTGSFRIFNSRQGRSNERRGPTHLLGVLGLLTPGTRVGVSGYRIQYTRIQDTGYRIQDTGYERRVPTHYPGILGLFCKLDQGEKRSNLELKS